MSIRFDNLTEYNDIFDEIVYKPRDFVLVTGDIIEYFGYFEKDENSKIMKFYKNHIIKEKFDGLMNKYEKRLLSSKHIGERTSVSLDVKVKGSYVKDTIEETVKKYPDISFLSLPKAGLETIIFTMPQGFFGIHSGDKVYIYYKKMRKTSSSSSSGGKKTRAKPKSQ